MQVTTGMEKPGDREQNRKTRREKLLLVAAFGFLNESSTVISSSRQSPSELILAVISWWGVGIKTGGH